jgi:16S rRNA G527 N7-methylase RsmG
MTAALVQAPDLAERLDRGLGELGFPLAQEARAKLLRFLQLIGKWNRRQW